MDVENNGTPRARLRLPSARVGVLVNALLGMALGTAISIIGWIMLADVLQEEACASRDVTPFLCETREERTVLWAATVSEYAFLFLLSIAGVVAAVRRQRRIALIYVVLLGLNILTSFILGITTIVLYIVVYAPRPMADSGTLIGLIAAYLAVWLWGTVTLVTARKFARHLRAETSTEDKPYDDPSSSTLDLSTSSSTTLVGRIKRAFGWEKGEMVVSGITYAPRVVASPVPVFDISSESLDVVETKRIPTSASMIGLPPRSPVSPAEREQIPITAPAPPAGPVPPAPRTPTTPTSVPFLERVSGDKGERTPSQKSTSLAPPPTLTWELPEMLGLEMAATPPRALQNRVPFPSLREKPSGRVVTRVSVHYPADARVAVEERVATLASAHAQSRSPSTDAKEDSSKPPRAPALAGVVPVAQIANEERVPAQWKGSVRATGGGRDGEESQGRPASEVQLAPKRALDYARAEERPGLARAQTERGADEVQTLMQTLPASAWKLSAKKRYALAVPGQHKRRPTM